MDPFTPFELPPTARPSTFFCFCPSFRLLFSSPLLYGPLSPLPLSTHCTFTSLNLTSILCTVKSSLHLLLIFVVFSRRIEAVFHTLSTYLLIHNILVTTTWLKITINLIKFVYVRVAPLKTSCQRDIPSLTWWIYTWNRFMRSWFNICQPKICCLSAFTHSSSFTSLTSVAPSSHPTPLQNFTKEQSQKLQVQCASEAKEESEAEGEEWETTTSW